MGDDLKRRSYPPGNGYISHLGKSKVIFQSSLGRDILVPRRVPEVGFEVSSLCAFFLRFYLAVMSSLNI